MALERGLEDKITFHFADAFDSDISPGSYDLVHWNNSLHHMFDVDEAVKWSRVILRRGGLFYMDDYIGQNRFQWSDLMLEIASKVRASLDKKYLVNPRNPNKFVSTEMPRPSAEELIKRDPSEAVQSFQILAALRKYFPDVHIVETGGVVYNMALHEIIHNFDEKEDRMTLELLMIIDDLSSRLGENHYAVAWASK